MLGITRFRPSMRAHHAPLLPLIFFVSALRFSASASNATMQTALSMADIRYVVAWDDTLRPCDLARLARVCRDWHDVAEAALWADLPDLTYLLKLMPRHLWSYVRSTSTLTTRMAH